MAEQRLAIGKTSATGRMPLPVDPNGNFKSIIRNMKSYLKSVIDHIELMWLILFVIGCDGKKSVPSPSIPSTFLEGADISKEWILHSAILSRYENSSGQKIDGVALSESEKKHLKSFLESAVKREMPEDKYKPLAANLYIDVTCDKMFQFSFIADRYCFVNSRIFELQPTRSEFTFSFIESIIADHGFSKQKRRAYISE
jgi:hypothetical protein